jgi:preprotein translocase subunit SecA
MLKALKKIIGTSNERELRTIQPIVQRVAELEPSFKALSDEQLKSKTVEFRQRLAQGQTLDSLIAEAFAAVREAGLRTMKMRHYDVQLIGGATLHRGRIAEMKTGEGKTLMATLSLYLNALEGKGCHLITVNDYLAQRDANWMRPLFESLGMTVGIIVHGLSDAQRREAYAADITYGTNNEFGFDYLRDNMKVTQDSLVQRELHYAIIDEVDSILIDEARTPLIISGPTNETTDKYKMINGIIPFLKRDVHFSVDEKARRVMLTDEGVEEVQKRLRIDNLYDPRMIELVHHVDQALRAHVLFKRDVDYVVRDGEVLIVDEFTGRLMPGRRYSDGLHQALEAKEGVAIANENQTLATITFQNYFRLYKKISGMTGTADTEAEEFASIYKLEVTVIPTNKPMVRDDQADIVYKSERAKFKAITADIRECHKVGQPVLVGTVSIEKSERLSELLRREGIPHVVLNAKHHEKEAHIVANAGQRGAVTIATNMAGRGTDIVLGEGVRDLGGLYILGTERHESRRIDNQLRGRAGRQGDPGKSKFYLSLEDDLLRIFAGDRILKLMDFFGMKEDEPLEDRLITRAIEDAQRRVEGRNFDIRKNLIKYDDVMNHQRKVIYAWRRQLLSKENFQSEVVKIIDEVVEQLIASAVPPKSKPDEWDFKELKEGFLRIFNDDLGISEIERNLESVEFLRFTDHELFDRLVKRADELYRRKEIELTDAIIRRLERMLLLNTIDDRWKEHLQDIERLKEGVGLRGYAEKDPVLAYQRESFDMFESLFGLIKSEFLAKLYRVRMAPLEGELAPDENPTPISESQRAAVERQMEAEQKERADRVRRLNLFGTPKPSSGAGAQVANPAKREADKVGRNDPCPCGSGKKFKKCHGATAAEG